VQRNAKDTFEAWLVGELLLVALLGSATALFLTNPALRNTYELPEGRLVLDTAVVLAATIVAILAGVRFSVEGRILDLLLAAGFCAAGVGTFAFSIVPVIGGADQGAAEAWAAIGSRVLAATLIALAPVVPFARIVQRKRALYIGIAVVTLCLLLIWMPLRGFGARLSLLDGAGGGRPFELTSSAPFDAALRRYVEFLTADGALEVDVEIDPTILLAPDEQIEVFRIVQEGLANVRKHAGAQRAEVWIGQRLGRRIVSVSDDGVGFDGESSAAGQGLRNMRLRAKTIEGGFALRSRPGSGTALEVVLRA